MPLATGAALEVDGGKKPFAHMEHDGELSALYQRNAEQLGRSFITPEQAWKRPASSDMGNVSLALPSIHPGVGIDSKGAVNHQPDFTGGVRHAVGGRGGVRRGAQPRVDGHRRGGAGRARALDGRGALADIPRLTRSAVVIP